MINIHYIIYNHAASLIIKEETYFQANRLLDVLVNKSKYITLPPCHPTPLTEFLHFEDATVRNHSSSLLIRVVRWNIVLHEEESGQ